MMPIAKIRKPVLSNVEVSESEIEDARADRVIR
jgi:hypothetical protein